MRSPVVWLCFAIVILCALSDESDARKSYHLIHGEVSPIYRSVLPTSGYRKITARILARRAPVQDDEYNEEDDEEDEEEDEEENEPDYSYGYPVAEESGYPYVPYDDGEEEEAEEDEEEQEEQDGVSDSQGRQAYINNNYVDDPHQSRQNNRVRPQNGNQNINQNVNRVPVRNNNNNRPAQQNRPINSPNRPHPNPNRRPNPEPNPGRPRPQAGNRVQQGNPPPRGNHPAPPRNQPNNNQRLTLKPVATSTQFVATPVADLILRLSISIAKPVGTVAKPPSRNVPVNKQHDDDSNDMEDKHVLKLSDEASNIDSVPVKVTVDTNQHDDVDEDDDKEQALSEVVTEEEKK